MKPIIFNTEMVKAILDGRKTQFRKVIITDFMNIEIEKDVMPQEVKFLDFKRYCPQLNFKDNGNAVFQLINRSIKPLPFCDGICAEIDIKPEYKVGDILWVREPAKIIEYTPVGNYGGSWNDCDSVRYEYLSDGEIGMLLEIPERFNVVPKWIKNCQGIPNGCLKEMARIFLKVTNVRVERLQDIRVRDIEKETGWKREKYSYSNKNRAFYKDYRDLWNLTAKDGYKWENNPYVFVYEFERVYDV